MNNQYDPYRPYPGNTGYPNTGYQNYPNYQTYQNTGYQPYASYRPAPYSGVSFNPFEPDPFEKNNIKKHISSTFIYALFHLIGSFILAQIFFIAIELSGNDPGTTADGKTIVNWVYGLAGSLPSVIFCISLFFIDKSSSHKRLDEYFKTDKLSAGFFLGFFGAVMFAYSTGIVLELIIINGFSLIDLNPVISSEQLEIDLTPAYLAEDFLTAVILAPVAEELMFRGLVMRRLSNVGQKFAIIVSALFFGLMHGNLPQAVMAFCVGIVFAYGDIKAQSLVPSILGHMFINFTATISTFVEYFSTEEMSEGYFLIAVGLFGFVGLIAILIMGFGKKIEFPPVSDYHKKRTWNISVTCVSFWIFMVGAVLEIILSFGKTTGTA